MKIQFRHERIEMLPDNPDEDNFAKELTRLLRAVSNNFMGYYGDVKFDGEETSGYVITEVPPQGGIEPSED